MSLTSPAHPAAFLEMRVHDLAMTPNLTALCAGFEAGQWRGDQLAGHAMQWLPEFALKYSEWRDISHQDAVKMVAVAARAVYKSKKYRLRGEFGELLLHIVLRQVFNSV